MSPAGREVSGGAAAGYTRASERREESKPTGETGRRVLGRRRRVVAESENEVAEAVRDARRRGHRLRPVGSGGSKNPVNEPEDVALRLEQPPRLLAVDGRRATVPAALTTGRLQSLLRTEGLVLPTVGEWKNATVAGSLATATHGGSARHGTMPSSVRRLRLVTGRGEIRELTPEDADFDHAGVSLGAFGAISRVTLECSRRFALRLETDVVGFGDYLDDPIGHESRSEFHASVWLPTAGRVVRFAAKRTEPPDEPVPRRERFGRRTAIATLLVRWLGLEGVVSSRFFGRTAVGDAAEILSPLEVAPGLARFRNVANGLRDRQTVELAVPASEAGDVLARFEDFFREYTGKLNNPIGLRVNPEDGFTLSPCSGRGTLWLDVFYDDDRPFAAGLAALAEEVDARCHWGKGLLLPAEALRASYPGWEAFAAARDRFDPDEVFASPLTDALGLTGSGPPGDVAPRR